MAWNDPQLKAEGSFPRVLEVISVPGAKLLVDFVVLVAVTSCMNSGLYAASPMFHSLGARGWGRAITKSVSLFGAPVIAVLLSTLAGFGGCLVNYVLPGKVLDFLLSTRGSIALVEHCW